MIGFFNAVDHLLGTDYTRIYVRSRKSTEQLIPEMGSIAALHSLGVLIIDEIQHLSSQSSGGQSKMLNFFVELTNTLTIPIILVGTYKAVSALRAEFRSVRRNSGQGESFWNAMENDEEWEIFLNTLWKYQYTQEITPLTRELSDCLFFECAGITDYAVKILMLAQNRAIQSGLELITVGLIQSVVRDQLLTSQPFLDAVRSRNFSRIGNFEDIRPVDVDACMAKDRRREPAKLKSASTEPPPPRPSSPPKADRQVSGTVLETFLQAQTEKRNQYEAFCEAGLIAAADDFLL